MPAYVLADMDVSDPDRFAEYGAAAGPTVASFGGRLVARSPQPVPLEGDWPVHMIVILEFPTLEQARAWYASAEYTEAKRKREGAASARMLLLEGYTPV